MMQGCLSWPPVLVINIPTHSSVRTPHTYPVPQEYHNLWHIIPLFVSQISLPCDTLELLPLLPSLINCKSSLPLPISISILLSPLSHPSLSFRYTCTRACTCIEMIVDVIVTGGCLPLHLLNRSLIALVCLACIRWYIRCAPMSYYRSWCASRSLHTTHTSSLNGTPCVLSSASRTLRLVILFDHPLIRLTLHSLLPPLALMWISIRPIHIRIWPISSCTPSYTPTVLTSHSWTCTANPKPSKLVVVTLFL